MVKHTHQDCLRQLGSSDVGKTIACRPVAAQHLSDVGPVDRTKELFDLNGHYVRKVSLSWFDRSIDNMSDWQSLVKRLNEVDKLLIVDDRIPVENPILNEYDRYTKQRYLDSFGQEGIDAELVRQVESDGTTVE